MESLFDFLALDRLCLERLGGFLQPLIEVTDLDFVFFPGLGQFRLEGLPAGQVGDHPERAFEFAALGADWRG